MPRIFEPLILRSDHAKRAANTAFILCRYPFNSFRRNDPFTAFLQQAQAAMANSEICQDPSTQYQLSPFRSHPRSPLCHNGGTAKNQQDRNPSIQWGLPFLAGPFQVSRSINPTPIPQEASTQNHSANRRFTRSAASQVVCLAQTPSHPGLRFRLCRHHDLRKVPVCQSRLQPQKARSEILPSPPVLRSPFAGILAWLPASRRCGYRHWSGSVSENLFGQSSPKHRSIANPDPCGFGFLCQKSHRIPRFGRLRLCDCGQRIPDDQSPGSGMSFPEASQWLGSGQVRLQTRPMEKTSSVCRGQTPDSRRSRRSPTVDPFQRPKICLSRFGHESEDPSLASLEILRQTGYDRKECSRAPLRLSSGQNPDRRLGSQCGFLSDPSLCLQHCPLVQKALL